MRAHNSCYTYFQISGDFDPREVAEMLGLKPDRWRKVGDELPSGRRSRTAYLEYGRCEKYDVEVENMMRATIAPLLDKAELLAEIREKYKVEFWLSVVPTVHVGEPSPTLAPPLDVIDFCHATRTEIDIDLYVKQSE